MIKTYTQAKSTKVFATAASEFYQQPATLYRLDISVLLTRSGSPMVYTAKVADT